MLNIRKIILKNSLNKKFLNFRLNNFNKNIIRTFCESKDNQKKSEEQLNKKSIPEKIDENENMKLDKENSKSII
jgi:hypothetical protein